MVSIQDIERDDPTFADDLLASQAAVDLVARWLGKRGWTVRVPELRLRPQASAMADYADGGDLFIEQRIEVKQRDLDFTCAEDFPYPTMIVDVAHTYDRAKPKPFAYIIVNRAGTHCAVITPWISARTWTKEDRYDKKKGRSRTFYMCPLAHCVFRAL